MESDFYFSDLEDENKNSKKEDKPKRTKIIEDLDKLASPAIAQLARNVLGKVKEICHQVNKTGKRDLAVFSCP